MLFLWITHLFPLAKVLWVPFCLTRAINAAYNGGEGTDRTFAFYGAIRLSNY